MQIKEQIEVNKRKAPEAYFDKFRSATLDNMSRIYYDGNLKFQVFDMELSDIVRFKLKSVCDAT